MGLSLFTDKTDAFFPAARAAKAKASSAPSGG